jgi:hypothetical protein
MEYGLQLKKKNIIINKVLIFSFLFVILLVPFSSSGILDLLGLGDPDPSNYLHSRGPDWDLHKQDGKFVKTQYMGQVNIPISEGSKHYAPYSDVTNFTITDNQMIIEWWDKNVTLEFYDKKNDKKEKFKDKNNTKKQELNFSSKKAKHKTSYYFTHNTTKEKNKQPDKFGYEITSSNGVDCKVSGYKLVCDEQVIDFTQAVVEQGLTVEMNDSNLSEMFIEISGDSLEYIDPVVTYDYNNDEASGEALEWNRQCDFSINGALPTGLLPGGAFSDVTNSAALDSLDSTGDFFTYYGDFSCDGIEEQEGGHRFNFTISENINDITEINWSITAKADDFLDADFALWNDSSSSWIEYANGVGAAYTNESVMENATPSDFITSNNETFFLFAVHKTVQSQDIGNTDFISLTLTYDGITVNSPSNNDEILNNLSDTLNISSSAYNETIWYSFSDGIVNYTMCTKCEDNETTITFPRQGSFNLTVWGNKSDGSETSKVVTGLFVGNRTVYNYIDELNINTTTAGVSEAVGGSHLPAYPVNSSWYSTEFIDYTNSTDLHSDDSNWIETGSGTSIDYFIYTQLVLPTEVSYYRFYADYRMIMSNNGANTLSFKAYNYSSNSYETKNTSSCASSCLNKQFNVNWTETGNTSISDYIDSSGNVTMVHHDNIDGTSLAYLDTANFTLLYSIGNTPPTPTIVTPNNTEFNDATKQNFTYNVTDDNDYINNITLFIYNSTGVQIFSNTTTSPALNTNLILASNLTLDGNYTYYFNATDTDNAVTKSEIRAFSIDTSPPVIDFEFPLNNTFHQAASLEVNYTRTDPDNNLDATSCKWSKDGGSTNTSLGTCQNISDTFSEGSNTVYVWASDTAGNEGANFTTFIVDLTDPVGAYNLSTETDGSVIAQNFIEINVSAIDTNLDAIEIRIFNSTEDSIQTNQSSTSPLYVNLSGLADGIYYFNATINDSSGRALELSTRNVTLDNTFPEINITYPINDSNFNVSIVEINYTYNETNPDSCWWTNDSSETNYTLASCGTNITGVTWAQGVNDITIYINDSAGNEESKPIHFFMDSINPLIEFGLGTQINAFNQSYNSIYTNVSVTETNEFAIIFNLYNSSGANINSTLSTTNQRTINWTGLPDGNYTYNVTINDTVSNENFTETRLIAIDTIFPDANITNISTTLGSQTVKFNHTASDTNLESCFYSVFNESGSIDGTLENQSITCGINDTQFVVSAFGSYNLTVYASDYSGNENSSTLNFTTADTAGNGTAGGGGGGDTFIIQNVTWTMTTEQQGDIYELEMAALSTRERSLLFNNKGAEEINLSIACTGDLCNFTEFDSNMLILPIGIDIFTALSFIIEIPLEIDEKTYSANIIATDQFDNQQIVTLVSNVGAIGWFSDTIDKILSRAIKIGGLPVPYLIIYLLIVFLIYIPIYFMIFRPLKIPGGKAWVFIISMIFSFAIIRFI